MKTSEISHTILCDMIESNFNNEVRQIPSHAVSLIVALARLLAKAACRGALLQFMWTLNFGLGSFLLLLVACWGPAAV
ncbi:hypothetical protein EOD39_0970 [Acipenser ruthenus]|uniref:Uncharacterized protein n=1 Tax=Acipenser ruthenus TaxID=7906 RepID=A0A444UIV5_ACIRT|nr:hypothetical protein EOD39_0970 [Acipenser ruthenus]